MQNVIQIKVKQVYGNETIYPVNDQAQLIAKIAGTKTLTKQALSYAKLIGFTIEQIQDKLAI